MEQKIKNIVEKDMNCNVLEIKSLSGGFSHHMYEIKIDKFPNEIIFRYANNKSTGVSLAKERFIMKLLQENKIPCPKIYVYGVLNSPNEQYMILEKIKSLQLDKIWNSLTKKEKMQITEEMGKILKRIHSIKFNHFGFIEEGGKIDSDKKDAFKFKQVEQPWPFNEFVREKLVEYSKNFFRLMSFKKISHKFFSSYIKFLDNNLSHIEYHDKPTLCHGDFIPGHVFVEKKNNKYKITHIIDFELSVSSSPDEDFVKLHRAGFFADKDLKKALEKGYGAKLNEKSIEIQRIMRDLCFAQIQFDSGDIQLGMKVLKDIETKIDNKFTSQS